MSKYSSFNIYSKLNIPFFAAILGR